MDAPDTDQHGIESDINVIAEESCLSLEKSVSAISREEPGQRPLHDRSVKLMERSTLSIQQRSRESMPRLSRSELAARSLPPPIETKDIAVSTHEPQYERYELVMCLLLLSWESRASHACHCFAAFFLIKVMCATSFISLQS